MTIKSCPATAVECSVLGSDAALWKTTNPGCILSFPLVTLLDQCKRTMTRCGSFSVSSWSRNTAVAWPSPSLLSSLPTYSWWWGNASSAAVRKKAKSHRFAVSWIFPCCPKVISAAGALQFLHGILCLFQTFCAGKFPRPLSCKSTVLLEISSVRFKFSSEIYPVLSCPNCFSVELPCVCKSVKTSD